MWHGFRLVSASMDRGFTGSGNTLRGSLEEEAALVFGLLIPRKSSWGPHLF